MSNQRSIAALLFVIAFSLVLITAKLYDIDLVERAYAEGSSAAKIYGCYIPAGKVQNEANCEWIPLKVSKNGILNGL